MNEPLKKLTRKTLLALGAALALGGPTAPRAVAQVFRTPDGFSARPAPEWFPLTPVRKQTQDGMEHEWRWADVEHRSVAGAVVGFTPGLPQTLNDDGLSIVRDIATAYMGRRFPGYRLVDRKVYLVGGEKTFGIRGNDVIRGKDMALDMLCTVHAGVSYIFILATPAQARSATEPAFARFITSVRWTPRS